MAAASHSQKAPPTAVKLTSLVAFTVTVPEAVIWSLPDKPLLEKGKYESAIISADAVGFHEISRGALSQDKQPFLVGGAAEILRFAEAAEQLMRGEKTFHPELACFDTWAEVQAYVEEDEQGDELRLMVALVDEFGADRIREALGGLSREEDADLIISTAHKSKGREWESVRIASDFPDDRGKLGDDEKRLQDAVKSFGA